MPEHHVTVTFPNETELEDFMSGIAHSGDATANWVKLHDDEAGRTTLFSEEDSMPIALQVSAAILKHRPNEWPYLSTPTAWTPEQRRRLVTMAVDSWHYSANTNIDTETIMTSCRNGDLEFIKTPDPRPTKPPAEVQVIINATQAQLAVIKDLMGLDHKVCYTATNGMTIYQEDGPTILSAFWKHPSVDNRNQHEWHELSEEAQTAVLELAAESPQWANHGQLNPYRVQEFIDCYPGILDPFDVDPQNG